ncbi:TPA: hypothetical protein SMP92_003483 [Pseudomonas putida]|uniref:hypothetical protein n=1 Tax=unclassified Pseudomonas TaxID=196821 RepID=UPI0029E9738A|nr:hypothetical protein [Pseudomonas putida]
MSFNLANRSFEERAQIEAEKARLFEMWQNNLGKAKADAARLISEKPRRKGKWAEWVRAELEGMSPPEYAGMVRSEVNKMMAAASSSR